MQIGHYSTKGRKSVNQDFRGALIPESELLLSKGAAVVIADGISSSDVSQQASQAAVSGFLEDYYCTPESWSVRKATTTVVQASNSWLFAQNQRNHEYRLNRDKGLVCTLSGVVFKSTMAHCFHVGDSQVSLLRGGVFSSMTQPHRVNVSETESYLARAMGAKPELDIDHHSLAVEVGDVFMLCSDGVHEYLNSQSYVSLFNQYGDDLNLAAQKIVEHVYEQGSADNLTVQLVRIQALPKPQTRELMGRIADLPVPPTLKPRMLFDGYRLVRELHVSSRSQIWLAIDEDTNAEVALKVPSTEGRNSDDYLDRFLLEEWIANRLDNPHVLKPYASKRARNFLYLAFERVNGCTLTQWMADNPEPSLDRVRLIIEQVAKGLQAFHRQEMLHQDLRPDNVMIDESGTAKIIDFGSTFVAGVEEISPSTEPMWALGTASYMAPEYLLGEFGQRNSDLYSLATIAYVMLAGRFPYGTGVGKARSRSQQRKLVYRSVLHPTRSTPSWVDLTLKTALAVDKNKRYQELSEFIYDLRRPNPSFVNQTRPPLLERDPVKFWQGVSAVLLTILLFVLAR